MKPYDLTRYFKKDEIFEVVDTLHAQSLSLNDEDWAKRIYDLWCIVMVREPVRAWHELDQSRQEWITFADAVKDLLSKVVWDLEPLPEPEIPAEPEVAEEVSEPETPPESEESENIFLTSDPSELEPSPEDLP